MVFKHKLFIEDLEYLDEDLSKVTLIKRLGTIEYFITAVISGFITIIICLWSSYDVFT